MGEFAFILHPLDVSWVAKKYGFVRFLPNGLVEFFLKYKSPYVLSRAMGIKSLTGAEVEGWFIACPLTSRQMVELDTDFVLGRVIESGKLAEQLGAKIVGLGAFTSVVGDAGITVAKHLNIPVTTGNSYTVAMALEATRTATKVMGINLGDVRVAIVGAAGSIGQVCAQILSSEVGQMVVVDRNMKGLEELQKKLGNVVDVESTTEVKPAIKDADVIITVASATSPIVEADDLKPGAVVCDVARPRNVAKSVGEQRDDVLVIEGGIVEVPGNFDFDFGFPPKTALACIAETMILALERRYESFTLGREIKVSQVQEILELAEKHGFKLAGLRSFDRPLGAEQIEAIKANALKKTY